MEGSCPRCNATLGIDASGEYACSRCHRPFQVYVTSARPATIPPMVVPATGTQTASLLPDARCAFHANNPAAGVCERCGDFMCGLCATPVEGRSYCPRCFDLLFQRGSLAFAQAGFSTPSTALTLAIVSVPTMFCYAGVPVAIIALVMAINALRQIARQPDLKGRAIAVWAIAIASLTLVGAVIVVLFTLFADSSP